MAMISSREEYFSSIWNWSSAENYVYYPFNECLGTFYSYVRHSKIYRRLFNVLYLVSCFLVNTALYYSRMDCVIILIKMESLVGPYKEQGNHIRNDPDPK